MSGTLLAIYIAPKAKQPMRLIQAAHLVPGRGIEGDRYYENAGSFSRWRGVRRALSLIEQETIDDVLAQTGIDLTAGQSRRNLVTRGVRLAELNRRTFRIGAAVVKGAGLCAPCRYLERLLVPGVYDALLGRGGLRAEVLAEGTIYAGDAITPIDCDSPTQPLDHPCIPRPD